MREIKGWLKWAISIILAGIALFNLYTAIFGVFQPRIQRGMLMLVVLPMAFLLFPATKKSPQDRPSVIDVMLSMVAVVPPLFIMLANERLNTRFELITPVSRPEFYLGLINILLVIEALRRVVVPMMAILVSIFFAYLFVAPYMSGVFYSRPMALERIVEINYLITNAGIYGSIVGVTATFVAIFVIFGAFMQNTKTGQYFTDLACKLAGSGPGGPAKIAVISSGLFGSISGVGAANVYATGVFTIPLMKRLGYRSQFAGAVEAAASTGGMLMPPVMGAGAFVMSEITGIPYIQIVVSAMLGAIFYYVSLIFRVHFYAKKYNLGGIGKDEQLPAKQLLIDSYQLIPLVMLIYLLVIGYSPFVAALWAIIGTFLLSFVKRETWMTPRKLFDSFRLAGQNMIVLTVSCAGADMIVSIVTYTGLALGISAVISTWSGGVLLPALLLIMFTSLLLGMGLPCTPAYIIAVTIGGPALQAMGIGIMEAHLFVFYFAILAGVTPPVCISSYCAASIAGSPPLQTGFEALRLASVGFIIPYIFIFNRSLLMQGPFMDILVLIFVILGAVVLTAAGMRGYLGRSLKFYEKVLTLLGAAVLIIFSAQDALLGMAVVQAAVLIVSGLIIFLLIARHRRLKAAEEQSLATT